MDKDKRGIIITYVFLLISLSIGIIGLVGAIILFPHVECTREPRIGDWRPQISCGIADYYVSMLVAGFGCFLFIALLFWSHLKYDYRLLKWKLQNKRKKSE